MSNINDFKDLMIWQKGIDIAQRCYFLTKVFPKEELYAMVQKISMSAASILANIAEGYARRYRGEYVRFLNIVQGSVNELEIHLILSERVGLCSDKDIAFPSLLRYKNPTPNPLPTSLRCTHKYSPSV